MKKIGTVVLMAFAASVAVASKRIDQGTLQNVQPTNFAVAKKQHQQYDFSVVTTGRSYECRTPANKKVNATDFPVGSIITFVANGKNGEVTTRQGKSAKCTITRLEDTISR